MSIYNPNAVLPNIGPDVATTVAASVTNIVAVPANPTRASSGAIVNNATKSMWVSFTGVAATTASPSFQNPANGGELDIPGEYTGAINAIWATGATGAATVHEFNYL